MGQVEGVYGWIEGVGSACGEKPSLALQNTGICVHLFASTSSHLNPPRWTCSPKTPYYRHDNLLRCPLALSFFFAQDNATSKFASASFSLAVPPRPPHHQVPDTAPPKSPSAAPLMVSCMPKNSRSHVACKACISQVSPSSMAVHAHSRGRRSLGRIGTRACCCFGCMRSLA